MGSACDEDEQNGTASPWLDHRLWREDFKLNDVLTGAIFFVNGEVEEINHALMVKDYVEKKPMFIDGATSFGCVNVDTKMKAPETECFSFSVPVNADDKKMRNNEMVINKKEMVLDVLMANNQGSDIERI
ncbi:hypothetical protein L1987_49213 [Smallanthus sonchifolius]|uniref:Uncharacterized protein n=1 Tax=Smallanthus sonchifolius TaxID=185202 RepID=A0ACB9FTF7_9ASTR|nr:hypothetical protein L1987_49213 [Smallanthus sonchifolius]